MIKITQSYPLFVTEKLDILKSFYEQYFGFSAVFFEPDFYLHLVHSETQSQIGFMVPNHPSQPQFLHAASNYVGSIFTLEVGDVKEALKAAEASKLELMLGFTEESWGQKHFMIKDPVGLLIDVVEYSAQ